jgi:hypothetical protein
VSILKAFSSALNFTWPPIKTWSIPVTLAAQRLLQCPLPPPAGAKAQGAGWRRREAARGARVLHPLRPRVALTGPPGDQLGRFRKLARGALNTSLFSACFSFR